MDDSVSTLELFISIAAGVTGALGTLCALLAARQKLQQREEKKLKAEKDGREARMQELQGNLMNLRSDELRYRGMLMRPLDIDEHQDLNGRLSNILKEIAGVVEELVELGTKRFALVYNVQEPDIHHVIPCLPALDEAGSKGPTILVSGRDVFVITGLFRDEHGCGDRTCDPVYAIDDDKHLRVRYFETYYDATGWFDRQVARKRAA